jgi:Fe-S cluster assembly protein SufD
MSAPAPTVRSSILERVLSDFRSVEAILPGDTLAQAARARAATALTELGWPSQRDEQWRYTNLRAFERLSGFRPPAAEPAAAVAPIELPPAVPGFQRLIYLDGSRIDEAQRIQIGAGAGAAAHAWEPEQRLGWLCDMFATDAAALTIRGEAAIEILFISSGAAERPACYPRLQLRLEPDSRLRLIERHFSAGAGAATLVAYNATVELARNATLTHYRLQQCSLGAVFIDTLSARLEDQARYVVRSIGVGAGSARTSARVQLAGRGAALTWQAIALGRGEQVHDIALKVEHQAPETGTEESFRGIADQRARVAFSGHIRIDPTAPGSQARQSLRGLIEGGTAEIDLRPRLEILTDDVRAVHGATTGRLDENLLFYLLSRGIDPTTARTLLKWAFLGDVLREIELPELRAEAERLAAGQLADAPALGALA